MLRPFFRRLPSLASVGAVLSAVALTACAPSPEDRIEEVRELQSGDRMEESIPILVDLIESGNREGEVLYRYGRALSLTGQAARSVWALDAARDDPEWFVSASQQLAMDAHRGGNYQFALEIFQRLHEEAPDDIDDDLLGLLLEARVMLDSQSHFEEADALLDSILDRFPEDETAIRMKAVALLGLRRPDEAYALLRKADVSPEAPRSGDPAKNGKDGGKLEGESGEREAKDGEAAGAESEDPGDFADVSDLYAEIPDESKEAYWCAVRVSFKREAGELDEAKKIADACLASHPSDAAVISQSVKLDSQMQDFAHMLATLEKAHEVAPEDPQFRAALVEYYERSGRLKDVERILRKPIEDAEKAGKASTPETAVHWVALAGFLLEHDRVPESLAAFDAANDIIGDDAGPELLIREAEALIRVKEYDEALKLAEKTPVEVHRTMLRGRIAFERGNYQDAIDELGKAALSWPNNAPTRYYRARAAEGVGDFRLAIEEYRQAIRSDPSMMQARERLARLHLAEGDVREAGAILGFESPRKPTAPSTAIEVLMVEVETRRGTDPDLDIAPSADFPIDKLRRETIRSLRRGLVHRAGVTGAAQVLAELEKATPPPLRGGFLRERVELLLEAGEHEAAVSEAEKGVAARADDLDSKLALGLALVGSGRDLDRAKSLIQKFVDQRPDDEDGWRGLGDVETRREGFAQADEYYDHALVVAPDDWEALSPRVAHLFQSGKREDAIRRLETFVNRDSPYDGRGALELARRLPDDEATRDRRIQLVRRAIRFGAGKEAIDLLAQLDPAAFRASAENGAETPAAPAGGEPGVAPAQGAESEAASEAAVVDDAKAVPKPNGGATSSSAGRSS